VQTLEKMMHAAPSSSSPLTYDPAALVDEYLRVLMIPDPVAARQNAAMPHDVLKPAHAAMVPIQTRGL
jgi:hypothetical protein